MAHRIPGHGQPILACQFSPQSSSRLATGSGDNTARIWDTETGTPKFTLKGHTGWVLGVSWSPDGTKVCPLQTDVCYKGLGLTSAPQLATCSMDKTVRIWDPETGKPISEFKGHAKWVLAVAWEPYHRKLPRPVAGPLTNRSHSLARRKRSSRERLERWHRSHLGRQHGPHRARPQWPQGERLLRPVGRTRRRRDIYRQP